MGEVGGTEGGPQETQVPRSSGRTGITRQTFPGARGPGKPLAWLCAPPGTLSSSRRGAGADSGLRCPAWCAVHAHLKSRVYPAVWGDTWGCQAGTGTVRVSSCTASSPSAPRSAGSPQGAVDSSASLSAVAPPVVLEHLGWSCLHTELTPLSSREAPHVLRDFLCCGVFFI